MDALSGNNSNSSDITMNTGVIKVITIGVIRVVSILIGITSLLISCNLDFPPS